jgi:hypothetical protein
MTRRLEAEPLQFRGNSLLVSIGSGHILLFAKLGDFLFASATAAYFGPS